MAACYNNSDLEYVKKVLKYIVGDPNSNLDPAQVYISGVLPERHIQRFRGHVSWQ